MKQLDIIGCERKYFSVEKETFFLLSNIYFHEITISRNRSFKSLPKEFFCLLHLFFTVSNRFISNQH